MINTKRFRQPKPAKKFYKKLSIKVDKLSSQAHRFVLMQISQAMDLGDDMPQTEHAKFIYALCFATPVVLILIYSINVISSVLGGV